MTDAPGPQDELDDLIADYADGHPDADRARRLLERIESDPDSCERLAATVVTERLLRAHGQGPVATARIMQAISAARALPSPPRATRAAGSGWNPLWTLALLAVIALGAVIIFRDSRPDREGPALISQDEPRASTPIPVSPPVPATEEPPVRPPDIDVAGLVADPVIYQRAIPLELPPVPPDVTAAPPGDGRDEPGFIAPAFASAAVAIKPGEEVAGARKEPDPPLLWVKLRRGSDAKWATTTDDLVALTDAVQARAGVRYGAVVRTLEVIGDDAAANPVIFFSTHYRFEFTESERAALRRYLLAGGMIVFNAGLGSRPAYDSARREMRIILPEFPILRLEPDHPVFHALADITNVAAQADEGLRLEGVQVACRTAAVISRRDLSAGWQGRAGAGEAAYPPEDALRLGANLTTYAATTRAWSHQNAGAASFPTALPESGRMYVAQIQYGGDWRTRYAALPALLQAFNQRTDIPVKFGVRTVRLTDEEVFNAPLIYMTGHGAITLSGGEIIALRKYLQSGGFLFAEACCGRRAFDKSFRDLMRLVLPASELTRIPQSSALFQRPNRLQEMTLTKPLAARLGSALAVPHLEGVQMGNTYGVVYSPFGLSGAWESATMPDALAYDGADALRMGQNILLYAITQ